MIFEGSAKFRGSRLDVLASATATLLFAALKTSFPLSAALIDDKRIAAEEAGLPNPSKEMSWQDSLLVLRLSEKDFGISNRDLNLRPSTIC